MCLVVVLRGNQSLPKAPLRLAHESGLGVTLASRQAGFAPPCPAQEAGSVASCDLVRCTGLVPRGRPPLLRCPAVTVLSVSCAVLNS